MVSEESSSNKSLRSRIAEWKWPLSNWKKKPDYKLDERYSDEVIKIADRGFATIYRCRDSNSNQVVFVKQINISAMSETVPSSVIREISLLKELDHPNIVRLLNVFARKKYVNLVFENLDIDLHNYIVQNDQTVEPAIVKSFMYQMLCGLAYCHAHKILHRGLRSTNVLVDISNRTVKLADFGLARPFGERDTNYTTEVGTRGYTAPEILFHSQQYTAQIDVWSLGCIFAEMLFGQAIFQDRGRNDELTEIFRLLGTPTEETWPGVTALCPYLHTFEKFEPKDLRHRLPLVDRKHLDIDLVSKMLVLDPTQRISVQDALNHPYFESLNEDKKGKSIRFSETEAKAGGGVQHGRCSSY